MIPGMNPKQLEAALKQLGMKMENLSATQVVIKTDEGDITINNPQVVKTTMKGQIVYQVSGSPEEAAFSEEDVKLVMEQTGVEDRKKTEEALKETNGEVVEAIMKLKS
ncbi:MAG: Nascent polypeptide-associated complex protein [Candidatus Aenigmarchaeota archaeon]|nr:Nascent polypeptide-associated complex protein [Candidatus Aenigmarchaeota archaeon]